MKILFDQNISHRLVNRILDIFPDAKQLRDIGIENSTDRQIWEFAKKEDYIIVSFDSDFYDFSLVWGHPPKIIWIRTWNQTTAEIEFLLRKHTHNIEAFVENHELACLEIINVR